MSSDSSDAQAAFGENRPPRQASKMGYWLAALVAFLAVAGAIAWFVLGFMSLGEKVDELHRLEVPGEVEVELDAGDKAMYWEGRQASIPPLDILVRAVDGPPVEVGPHGSEVTYEVDGHDGTAIAGFDIPQDGRYLVRVSGPEGGLVAFGDGVGGRIVSAVVGGLGIFFGGLLLSGLLIIITAQRRKS